MGEQCLGGQVDRRAEGHRRDGTADFFGEHAQAFMPQVGAAVGFRHGRAEPAHVGHAFPERAVVGVAALEDLAHRLGGGLVLQEASRLLAQLLQVV